MAVAYQLKDLSYGYHRAKGSQQRLVLRNVDATIHSGHTTTIVGRSGIGKSTLLYLLGLLWEGELNSGTIEYGSVRGNGYLKDIQTFSSEERAWLRRNEFGFLMQSAFLLPNFSCIENLALPLVLKGMSWKQSLSSARGYLELADGVIAQEEAASSIQGNRLTALVDLGTRYGQEVSGGERKRLALLRAIMHQPDILLADEPLSNLDPFTRRAMVRLLDLWRRRELDAGSDPGETRELVSARTLVLVTHDLDDVYEITDYFLVFRDNAGSATVDVVSKDSLAHGKATLKSWLSADERCKGG